MSAPVKFLAVAVAGWVTFRAAANAIALPEVAMPPAPAPTAPPTTQAAAGPPMTYVPIEPGPGSLPPGQAYAAAPPYGYAPAAYPYPPAGYPAPYGYGPPPPGWGGPPVRPAAIPMPVYYPVPMAAAAAAMPLPRQTPWAVDRSGGLEGEAMAADEVPMSRPVAVAIPDPRPGTAPSVTALTPAGTPRLDRWSLSSWSLVRQETAGIAPAASASPALAAGGQLGGSQAGSRLTFRVTPRLSANLRFSAPIPSPGSRNSGLNGEAALGVAWQPVGGVPLRLMAERRQRVGDPTGGRSAFALLAEGGVYGRALPLGFTLDGYGQSGIVSLRGRDWFVDGGLAAERPLFGRYSAGFGVWGGAQKGLNRLDVGPRVSARLTRNIRLSLDYRYRAFGNAQPGNGFAVSVGSDF